MVSFVCCLSWLWKQRGLLLIPPTPSSAPHPVLGQACPPGFVTRREKRQQAAKSITNMASLGTAKKQAISNRRLWCLSHDTSIAVVGVGSQMLTHQGETQSETQADCPTNLVDFYLDVYKPHLDDVTLFFLSPSDYTSLLCWLLQTPHFVFCIFGCFYLSLAILLLLLVIYLVNSPIQNQRHSYHGLFSKL